MTGSTFSVVFYSDISNVKHAVNEALNYLCNFFPEISSEDFFEFKLLMNELLSNAVIHGNNNDSSKKVSFEVNVVGENAVMINVTDEGIGYDVQSLLDISVDDNNILDESGRGVKIINSLADWVSCNKLGNEIKIYKKVVSYE